ncbi:MAG: hypothetical protein HY736_18265 [Verrucomicrobia bacterium]|nr:hypothetical protein [Verrucomicrobiota bacterium]
MNSLPTMDAKSQTGQTSLDIVVPTTGEQALQILRNEYLRNDGDLTQFFAEIARLRPKASDPSDSWTLPGRLLHKQL